MSLLWRTVILSVKDSFDRENSLIGVIIWNPIPNDINNTEWYNKPLSKIEKQKLECMCRLFLDYLQNLGFVDITSS